MRLNGQFLPSPTGGSPQRSGTHHHGTEGVLRGQPLALEGLADGLMGDLAGMDIKPITQVLIILQRRQTTICQLQGVGSVALVKAMVDVRATPPGMLATQ